jgi:phosphatidylserine synthase
MNICYSYQPYSSSKKFLYLHWNNFKIQLPSPLAFKVLYCNYIIHTYIYIYVCVYIYKYTYICCSPLRWTGVVPKMLEV